MKYLRKRDWLYISLLAFSVSCGLSLAAERSSRVWWLAGVTAVPASWAAVGLSRQPSSGRSISSMQRDSPSGDSPQGDSTDTAETAIFWDYENVRESAKKMGSQTTPVAESIVEYSKSQGHVRVKAVYANWRRENESVAKTLYSMGFEPIHISLRKANSVDVKLAVDCLTAAYQYPNIKNFIIVTADKDFIPLANALKSLERRVTLVGRAETASDELIMSADQFISLEELPNTLALLNGEPSLPAAASSSNVPKPKLKVARPVKLLDYEVALDCLLMTIERAQDRGSSTRFAPIDILMRSSTNCTYQGANCIRKPSSNADDNGRKTFETFSEFVAQVEADGKVHQREVDGFQELFLASDDDVPLESEAGEEAATPVKTQRSLLDRQDWVMIVELIHRALEEGRPGPTYGRFKIFLAYVRRGAKEGKLPNNFSVLRNGVSQLAEVGVLVRQDDGSYRLAEDWDANQEQYLDQLL